MKPRKIVYCIIVCLTMVLLSACSAKINNVSSDADGETPDFKPVNEIVADTAWINSSDGSYMTFAGKNDYAWYKDKNDTDDNYYMGTYRFYMGDAAMKYITVDFEEYGVTEEELFGVFKKNEEYSLDNFVCMTVTNNSFLLDGEDQLSEPTDSSYFGFLLNDGTYLDIADMKTGTYYGFKKE